MDLDKPCYPIANNAGIASNYEWTMKGNSQYGLRFKERLIIALASNPAIVSPWDQREEDWCLNNANKLIEQYNVIIKQLEKV